MNPIDNNKILLDFDRDPRIAIEATLILVAWLPSCPGCWAPWALCAAAAGCGLMWVSVRSRRPRQSRVARPRQPACPAGTRLRHLDQRVGQTAPTSADIGTLRFTSTVLAGPRPGVQHGPYAVQHGHRNGLQTVVGRRRPLRKPCVIPRYQKGRFPGRSAAPIAEI